MSWEYRVVKHTGEDDGFVRFDIREVLSSNGSHKYLGAMCSKPANGYTLEELKADLKMMLVACNRPVLEEKEGKLIEVEG